jgi:uncharacterized protein (DUF362 family)
MVPRYTRRSFIEKAALGTAAYGFMPLPEWQAPPAMAIASFRNPEESDEAIREEAIRLTEASINALGGMERFVSRGDVVFVKPNIGWDKMPAQAACTNPDVVATIVRLCFEAGAGRVKVSDYPCNDQRRTFLRSGIQAAAEAEGADVFFMDRRKFREMDIGGENLRRWPMYVDYVECDRRINVPIAKHHNLTGLTLTIKNLMGVIGGERNRIHQNLGPAMADVAKFVPSDLVVLDAVRVLTANGPTGGSIDDVERRDTIVAGTDTVAVEAFGATLFGLDSSRIDTTRAGAALGLGTVDYESLNPVRTEV